MLKSNVSSNKNEIKALKDIMPSFRMKLMNEKRRIKVHIKSPLKIRTDQFY
jgi:predicted phage tail protein